LLSERPRVVVGRTVAALRRSRSALVHLEGQLDDLLVRLRSPDSRLDGTAPDRLAQATAEASAAMASLQALGSLFG
jgi:hypothetical protein